MGSWLPSARVSKPNRSPEGGRRRRRLFGRILHPSAFVLFVLIAGCHRTPHETVVLYTSVDEPYVRPVIARFEKQTGISVTLLTDVEASKSVGLAERLRAEKSHPQADVWWGNECFLTIRLANDGILQPYASPSASDIPSRYQDSGHRWAGSALRVRTLVASAGPTGPKGISTIRDLLRPELKGKIALARPTAGTTGGHVAALYALWGDDRARAFFTSLHQNEVHLLGGNGPVADAVAMGDIRLGLCDNDDAYDAATNSGGKLDAILPDQENDADGTLAMPCAAGLVAGAPHPDAAKRLIDFVLSSQTDQDLIAAHFAWCSARHTEGKGRFAQVDYQKVADIMPRAIREATALMEGR